MQNTDAKYAAERKRIDAEIALLDKYEANAKMDEKEESVKLLEDREEDGIRTNGAKRVVHGKIHGLKRPKRANRF